MIEEVWKSLSNIVQYGDYYEISNLGNLRSIDKKVVCKNGAVKYLKGTTRSTKKNNRDYVMATLFHEGKQKTVLIHRLVALAFIPNLDGLPEVNHCDGNKDNNRIDNLEWMTSKDNQNHARNNGLSNQHGENSVNSRLTNEDAERVRNLWDTGNYTQRELSKVFSVSMAVIGRIVRREAYINA